MSADHLTPTDLSPVVTAVLAVLAGCDLTTAAASHLLDPDELGDAVQLYHAAGGAALTDRAEHACFQANVQFPNWEEAETIGATQLGPALDRLQHADAIGRWWFLRKHPCWRLRMHHADPVAVTRVLDDLARTGALARWWPAVYEPETYAFGGLTSMAVVHDLFAADTRGILGYLRQPEPQVERRELSLLLLNTLLRTAGLDHFERGDVFARLAQLRPAPTEAACMGQLTMDVRALLAMPTQMINGLFNVTGPLAHAKDWLGGVQTAASRLKDLAARGHLGRGIRAVLAQTTIFHWNRLGLSATTQGILARAAATALLPGDPSMT